MAIEIERKFLPSNDSWRSVIEQSLPMWQVYLGGEGISIRVRISGQLAWINIKQKRIGFKRHEFEYAIPLSEAEELAALATGPVIEKTRHIVMYEGLKWEIDEFEGDNAGLVVAEIELEHEQQAFPLPAWAGREVTDEERYYNSTLARFPYSQWSDA